MTIMARRGRFSPGTDPSTLLEKEFRNIVTIWNQHDLGILSWDNLVITSFTSASANSASAGVIRLANGDAIAWRNAANNADITLKVDSTNNFIFSNPVSATQLIATNTTNQAVLGTTRTVTITAPTPATSSRTWTIPDISGNGTFAALEATQTFSGTNTFSVATFSANSASAGVIRLANGDAIAWRNNANNGNNVLSCTTGDYLLYNGAGLYLASDNTQGTAKLNVVNASQSAIYFQGDTIGERYSTDTAVNTYTMRKARGTFASPTIVANGDGVNSIVGQAYDGSAFRNMAEIIFEAEGVPALNVMPGRIRFLTTTTSALIEAARFDSNQIFTLVKGITISATTNQIVLGTTNTTTITSPAPAAARTYTIPDAGGAANFIMSASSQTIAGQITFSSATLHASGSAASPGISFSSNSGTGLYQPSANVLGVTLNGALAVDFHTAGTSDATLYQPMFIHTGGNSSTGMELTVFTQTGITSAAAKQIAQIDAGGCLYMIMGDNGAGGQFFDMLLTGPTTAAPLIVAQATVKGGTDTRTYTKPTTLNLSLQMSAGTYSTRVIGFDIAAR